MTEKVLIVDDDHHICDLVRIALESEGFEVETALDGKSGMEKIQEGGFVVLLLDIMLPEKDGWEICREIRGGHMQGIPIIMLTARGEEVDRVLGLEMGADDYVTKPFSPRELVARVKALIRRSDKYNKVQDLLQFGNLTVDMRSYIVRVGETELDLTPKEIELMTLFAHNEGKTFTREELLRQIWGFDSSAGGTRTVDEHIKRLRSKIARYDKHVNYIQTVWGKGYKFEVKEL